MKVEVVAIDAMLGEVAKARLGDAPLRSADAENEPEERAGDAENDIGEELRGPGEPERESAGEEPLGTVRKEEPDEEGTWASRSDSAARGAIVADANLGGTSGGAAAALLVPSCSSSDCPLSSASTSIGASTGLGVLFLGNGLIVMADSRCLRTGETGIGSTGSATGCSRFLPLLKTLKRGAGTRRTRLEDSALPGALLSEASLTIAECGMRVK